MMPCWDYEHQVGEERAEPQHRRQGISVDERLAAWVRSRDRFYLQHGVSR